MTSPIPIPYTMTELLAHAEKLRAIGQTWHSLVVMTDEIARLKDQNSELACAMRGAATIMTNMARTNERLALAALEREECEYRIPYDYREALELARLWHQGKLIGGDPYGVCDALLQEIERLNEGEK